MPFVITLPKLSPTMHEGTISKWHKKIHDKINVGDLIIEVATDKASVEYNAIDPGYLREILVKDGQSCEINDPIAICSLTPDEPIETFKNELISKKANKTKEVKKTVTKEPSSTSTQSALLKQSSFEIPPPVENYEFPFPTSPIQDRISASPLAKKLAKEKGLDLTTVKGSGPHGRITSKDLDLAQKDLIVSFEKRHKPEELAGSYEEIPLTPMRKVIAERLQMAKNSIPHIYISQTVNADNIVSLRDQLKVSGLNITINDFLIKACSLALKEHPVCNAGFNAANLSIVRFKTIDISVAVSVEAGLITPVIRYADFKNLGEISAEVKFLAQKAKNGKLEPQEYKGGSFTISNLGKFGVSEFSAIINPPQAMILAVAGIQEAPIVKNGEVHIGKIMNLTVSADHRVLDGSDVALWLKTLQKYIENPALLLL